MQFVRIEGKAKAPLRAIVRHEAQAYPLDSRHLRGRGDFRLFHSLL